MSWFKIDNNRPGEPSQYEMDEPFSTLPQYEFTARPPWQTVPINVVDRESFDRLVLQAEAYRAGVEAAQRLQLAQLQSLEKTMRALVAEAAAK